MTFNQELYIETAIKSFLMQEVDYKFEIIIHDDASTDNTSAIIAGYAEKYSSIIRIIQQLVNQYSQKPTLPTLIALNNTKAEYIALCEGDDYWISSNKLQCQYFAMQKNTELSLSFHASKNIYPDGKFKAGVSFGSLNKVCSLSSVICGGGGYMPTASLMFKRELLPSFDKVLTNAHVGDFYMQVLGSSPNGALYIAGLESAYRKQSEGSWSESRLSISKIQLISEMQNVINIIKGFERIEASISSIHYALASETAYFSITALKSGYFDLSKLIIEESWSYKKSVNTTQKIMYRLRKTPRLILLLLRLKNMIIFK